MFDLFWLVSLKVSDPARFGKTPVFLTALYSLELGVSAGGPVMRTSISPLIRSGLAAVAVLAGSLFALLNHLPPGEDEGWASWLWFEGCVPRSGRPWRPVSTKVVPGE
jgi:hypothetical protein